MNLVNILRKRGTQSDNIPTTLDIFMKADVFLSGELDLKPSRSRAGDYIEFRVEMSNGRFFMSIYFHSIGSELRSFS